MTGHRILYVDDDPGLSRLVQRRLERLGYAVALASGGVEGLALIEAGGVDVVALDHYMPGRDGLDVLGAIRSLPDPPPVIFVTGTNEGRIAVAALKTGAIDYVVKDVEGDFVELLEAAVQAAMASVSLRREKDAADREVRAARDRFEALAAERQVLMREVNHRVGNSLQLVAAFLHLQAASAASEETRAALGEANRRVLAVAQVHRRLYASDDVKAVALEPYLVGLVDDIRQSTDGRAIGDHLLLEAEDVMVDVDTAVTIGIIVTELVINAMKYAYPGGSGPIRVTLRAAGQYIDPKGIHYGGTGPTADSKQAYVLAVEDDGVGRDAGPATSGGLGKTIIDAMAAKLATTVTYDDDAAHAGTRAVVTIRLPDQA